MPIYDQSRWVYVDNDRRFNKVGLAGLGRTTGVDDAFGRLRTSSPVTVFDSQVQYDAAPLLWATKTVGSGQATHVAADSTVGMTVTSAANDRVVRQTRAYHRYQPGKSQLALVTFCFQAADEGVVKYAGYGDDANGIFFKMDGAALSVVLRTSSSGSVVDREWTQAEWNGNTPEDFDATKSQIFWIDLEWLGVGAVRCGWNIDGKYYLAHEVVNANVVSTTYMTTANLPVRYEIVNEGGTASGSMLAICCSVISEGGFEDERGYPFGAGNGATPVTVSTRRPVASIRPKATFNSIVNRGQIVPGAVDVYAASQALYVEIVYGGTLTDASFASVNASSITEVDVAATAISGGITLGGFYVAASNANKGQSSGAQLLSRLPLALDIDGANPINLTVVATAFTSSSGVAATLNWKEFR